MEKSLNDREPVQVPRSQVSVKTAATVTAVVLAVAALAWIVVHSAVSITVTVIAVLLAIALNHGVEWLQKFHIPRGLGILIMMLLVIAVVAGIAFLIIPAASAQIQDLATHWPQFLDKLEHSSTFQWLDQHLNLTERIQRLQSQGGLLQTSAQPALKVVSGVVAAVAGVVTVLFLLIFMLLYGGRLVRGLLAETLPAHRERYERVLGKLYRSIGGYLTGLGGIALLNATLMSIFLAIIRVPFFLPLGILSGMGSLVPLIGVTVSGLVITLVALVAHGTWAAIAVVAYILVYQQFENHVVAPLIYKRTVQVNPLVTILGFVFLAELAGLIGAILTVPIIASVQIVARELFVLRRERLGLPLEGDIAQTDRRRPFWKRPRHA